MMKRSVLRARTATAYAAVVVAAWSLGHLAILCLLGVLLPAAVGAQSLPLKLAPPASTRIATCSPDAVDIGGPVVAPVVIDSLIDAGVMAGLRGDHEEARLLFRQVSFLDPSNPVVPYRLAVTLEALGDAEGAVAEYCRYIALNPMADDVPQTERRVRQLSERANAADAARRRAADAAVAAYWAGRYADAVAAFDNLVESREEDPVAWYNRGVSRIASGDTAAGIADLDRYLALAPDAEDRDFVRRYLDNLPTTLEASDPADAPGTTGGVAVGGTDLPGQSAEPEVAVSSPSAPGFPLPPAPGSVLLRGLLIPGLGQLTTGRPAFGVLVLGATAGAAAFGMIEETALETRIGTDPFGNRYEYEVEVASRPNQTLGLAIAGGVALVGALEGYFHTRGEWARLSMARGAGTIGMAITIPGP